MKILLAPYGTRGDVQPLVALGIALRNRGHHVEVNAPDNFKTWIESLGLPFHPAGIDVESVLREIGDDSRSVRWQLRHVYEDLIPVQFNSLASTFEDADIIIGASLQFAGPSVAELRHVPYLTAVFCPAALPSSHHAALPVRWQKLPRIINLATWLLTAAGVDLTIRRSLNNGRRRLGLAPISSPLRHLISGDGIILAADHVLAPPPPDLPGNVSKTDAFVLEEAGTLDSDLIAFLNAGSPPIYVGFGSMVTSDAEQATAAAIEAARFAGCRLIIGSGWTRLGLSQTELPEWCYVVNAVPHHLLFARCAAVVHHGGAGTTTTAARAGVPQIIVPHVLDQFYWAHRIELLGLGPKSLPFTRLTPDGLSRRIEALLEDSSYARRAATMGHQARPRDGVADAVSMIEELAA